MGHSSFGYFWSTLYSGYWMASSEFHQIIAANCMPVVTTTGILVN
jgi:hypothetical protein